jgi:hypothetical protein
MVVQALINVLEDELKALDPNSKEATRVSIKLDII